MPVSPLIGLTLRVLHEKGLPADLARNRAYFDSLETCRGDPTRESAHRCPSRDFASCSTLCDGLCLPGGPDVEPHAVRRGDARRLRGGGGQRARPRRAVARALGDREPTSRCSPSAAARRCSTLRSGGRSGRTSVRRGRPSTTIPQDGSRQEVTHNIDVAADTRLHAIAGATLVDVNSMHHQALRDIGHDLVVSARAHDGLVEAVEHPGRAVRGRACSATPRSCTSSATGRAGCLPTSSPPRVRES